MLSGYFDESGHSQDPTCKIAGMAGFVAPAGVWEVFEEEWKDTLRNAGLTEAFHMRDFAHSTGQFKDWKGKEVARRMLFGRLIEIIQNTRAEPIGLAVSLEAFASLTSRQQDSFKDPYYLAFQICTRGAALDGMLLPPEERINLVYALNSEFGTAGGRAEELWSLVKQTYPHGGRSLGMYRSATPEELCPLQAADLFAYELCHEFENRIKRPDDPMRWGLRRIMQMNEIPLPRIRFFDRAELLRQIKEAHFPDQTGVEEIAENQIRKHQAETLGWVIGRGEWDGEFPEFAEWDEWKRTNRGKE